MHTNQSFRKVQGLTKWTLTQIIYHMETEMSPEYRIRFQTTKELIKVFAHALPAKEILLGNYDLNTSYSKSYNDFKVILNQIKGCDLEPKLR